MDGEEIEDQSADEYERVANLLVLGGVIAVDDEVLVSLEVATAAARVLKQLAVEMQDERDAERLEAGRRTSRRGR